MEYAKIIRGGGGAKVISGKLFVQKALGEDALFGPFFIYYFFNTKGKWLFPFPAQFSTDRGPRSPLKKNNGSLLFVGEAKCLFYSWRKNSSAERWHYDVTFTQKERKGDWPQENGRRSCCGFETDAILVEIWLNSIVSREETFHTRSPNAIL